MADLSTKHTNLAVAFPLQHMYGQLPTFSLSQTQRHAMPTGLDPWLPDVAVAAVSTAVQIETAMECTWLAPFPTYLECCVGGFTSSAARLAVRAAVGGSKARCPPISLSRRWAHSPLQMSPTLGRIHKHGWFVSRNGTCKTGQGLGQEHML